MDKKSPIMRLENINMYFKKRTSIFAKPTNAGAIVDVSVDINQGEIVALVGESGCGKTTMGKVICGLLKPTSGTVYFKGQDISKMDKKSYKEFREGVQLVQQDSYAALNSARTIYQSLAEPLISKKLVKNHKEARARVSELLKTVSLNPPEQFLQKYPHQLSGGQRQRILMARAISMNPKVIVADEPISMIDVSLRISILKLMADLNKNLGIAFVYITHDLATARYIAQNGKIAVMYLGKIVETGDVNLVIENARHPYLQALLSAVPIPDPTIAKLGKKLPLKSLDMPSITNPPKGCRFNPRCIYATEVCEKEEPKLVSCGQEFVACHNVEEIPVWKLPSIS